MKVSVICLADRPQRLPVLVWSLIAQTHRDWELWILDQTEAHDVNAHILNVEDPRIRRAAVSRAGDWGQSAKEWAAREVATGEALMFPNDDAYYVPIALETMVAVLTRGVDLALCGWLYDLLGYRPMPPNPTVGHVDVGGFMVRRKRLLEFGWPSKAQTGDGQLIEGMVAAGVPWGGCPAPMYVKN